MKRGLTIYIDPEESAPVNEPPRLVAEIYAGPVRLVSMALPGDDLRSAIDLFAPLVKYHLVDVLDAAIDRVPRAPVDVLEEVAELAEDVARTLLEAAGPCPYCHDGFDDEHTADCALDGLYRKAAARSAGVDRG